MAQRTVYACQACQPPPLSLPTVSKRVIRKVKVDDSDSNSDEDAVISENVNNSIKKHTWYITNIANEDILEAIAAVVVTSSSHHTKHEGADCCEASRWLLGGSTTCPTEALSGSPFGN